jgi:aprataxin
LQSKHIQSMTAGAVHAINLTPPGRECSRYLLVLARDASLRDGPSALRFEHVPLLERMVAAGRTAAVEALAQEEQGGGGGSDGPSRTFRLGFHAVPSMPTLHLHVVSQDLRGGAVHVESS